MRRFHPFPAIPANDATIIMFTTHKRQPGGSGTLQLPDSGTKALVDNHILDAVTVTWLRHNKASAVNGLRVYATDDGGDTWYETDLKDDLNVPTVGAGAPIQVPALASGTEWRETFVVSHLKGVSVEYTAGPDNSENWNGFVATDWDEQTIAR